MNKIKYFLRPAAIISALPNTIPNGNAVDATPVMADFNHIVNQVNANAADVSLVALLAAANTFTLPQSGVSATSAANFPIATQVQNSVFLTLTSTLGTNAITARCAALALGALANGQIFTFIPSQTNTGPVTLDAGPGAATVFFGGTNVTSGQLIKDIPVVVRYQSPVFHMISMNGALGTLALAGNLAIATNKFTVDAATGNTVVAGTLDISGAAAGQIKFPATQNASSNANTLDDYDEYLGAAGACTGAVTANVGWKLVKVGNMVTLTLPDTISAGVATNSFSYATVIPAKYRPSATTRWVLPIIDNGADSNTPGMMTVVASTGVISVYRNISAAGNFTVTAQAGIDATAVSWTL